MASEEYSMRDPSASFGKIGFGESESLSHPGCLLIRAGACMQGNVYLFYCSLISTKTAIAHKSLDS